MARKGYGRNNSLVNVSTHADDGTSPVGSNEWNENPKNDGIFGLAKKTEPVSSYSIDITDSYVEVTSSSNEEIRTMVQVTDVLPAANYGASHDGSDSSKTDGASTAIKSFAEGDLLYLVKATAGHVITLKHQYDSSGGAGKITTLTGGDLLLDVKIPRIFMCRTISGVQEWVEYGGGTASDLDTTNFAANIIDTDLTSVAGTDTTIPSAKAVKDYVDTQITAEDLDTAGDSGTGAIDLNSQSLTVSGGSGITTTASSQAITIAGDDATTSAKGVASFAAGEFTVSSGAVSVNAIAEGKVTGLTSALGLKAPLDAPALTGTATAVNLTMSGDLIVNGTSTTINTATLSVEDPLIKLASGNNAADTVDVGFYGLYDVGGTDKYAGIVRDASDSGKFIAFKDLQTEPTTTVDKSATGYTKATIVADIEGDVAGNASGLSAVLADNRMPDLTGEVTTTEGAVATVIADDIIDEANLKVNNSPTDGYVLKALASASGGLTWGTAGGAASVDVDFSNTTTLAYRGSLVADSTHAVGNNIATRALGTARDMYIRKIDDNNEGVFTVIHKNGTLTEVQIA